MTWVWVLPQPVARSEARLRGPLKASPASALRSATVVDREVGLPRQGEWLPAETAEQVLTAVMITVLSIFVMGDAVL